MSEPALKQSKEGFNWEVNFDAIHKIQAIIYQPYLKNKAKGLSQLHQGEIIKRES